MWGGEIQGRLCPEELIYTAHTASSGASALIKENPTMNSKSTPGTTTTAPEINYPLVEESRPSLYRAMKYWGKKPHNIWSQYIERYCPPGGVVADPFSGSAVAAFEAVKSGRKAIAFDLNPLTSFIIEVTASRYDEQQFLSAANAVREAAESHEVYQTHYVRIRDKEASTVLNYRWEHNQVTGVALERSNGERILVAADDGDRLLADQLNEVKITSWHPSRKFPAHPSITHRFVRDIGGSTIDTLWTRRNLSLLASMFETICATANKDVRLQLLSAFIQTLHLCTKMVIPRNEAANREFSGSWGRPDYIVRRRRMEQNPVDVFWRSCVGRQSVSSMMRDAAATFPRGITINDVRATKKIKKKADINYGAVDVADILDFISEKSIDFVITDPPYAGLIRYLPLSVVWLSWLEKLDRKYEPALEAEIAVEKNSAPSRDAYRRRLRNAFERIHRILSDEAKLVVTFHHQDVREFNDFILAVKGAGFIFDKVTHQYNRRSGESNVANPYGVSGSDFYIRCVKRRDIDFTNDATELERYLIDTAINIIGRRSEPTPYSFLFQALWPELLQAGFVQPQDSRDEVTRILKDNEGPGRIFTKKTNTDPHVGDLWWFTDPSKHISHPDRPLKDRVSDSVLTYMRRHTVAKLDDVIGNLFKEYPNGLTPDPRAISDVLETYAFRSQGKWKIRPETIIAATRHSDTIASIVSIGQKLGYRCFVGRREQPEYTSKNLMLRSLADMSSLDLLRDQHSGGSIDRLEMVDVVFVSSDPVTEIACLWEVENSTNFGSAIQRGSNASAHIPKIMVIPDNREAEIRRIGDPLFRTSFAENSWRYITYADLARAESFSATELNQVLSTSKSL